MSGATIDPAVKKRRLFIRLGLVAVYFLALALVLVTGRGHTLLIDNKDAADGSYAAVDGMAVSINGGESSEYYPGDRDRALIQGQRHRVSVEFFDGRETVTRAFRVPFGADMLIISVPKMLAGQEPFVEIFVPQMIETPPEPEEPAEEETPEAPPATVGTGQ